MRLDAATRERLRAIAEEVLALKRDDDRRYSGEADVLTQEAAVLELSARLDDSATDTALREAQLDDHRDVIQFRASLLELEKQRAAMLERAALAGEKQAEAFTKIATLLETK